MTLSDQSYLKYTDSLFNTLLNALEEQCKNIEIDIDDNSLTIECQDGKQFLLSKHKVTKEIWLSSPISGAWHFTYDASQKAWISTRDDTHLIHILKDELTLLTKTSINI